MPKTLVIVGAGFSGTVLAANLLRRPPAGATEILLIERSGVIGRGVAYAARDFPYLLNVPAARLSADSHDPLQFLHFARNRLPSVDGEDFLPRALYGDYLQDLLLQAERAAPPQVRLIRVFAEVIDILRPTGGAPLTLKLQGRPALTADVVILALGNPPAPLPAWAQGLRGHNGFHQDPWGLPQTLGSKDAVLIVGNGLTMVDAATSLSRHADRVPTLHTISRRGLLPKPQTTFYPQAMRGSGEALLESSHSLQKLLRATRSLAREVEKLGGDWREAVAFIRSLAPTLWRRLPDRERRRFVRHLHVHWDTYRHRMPPELMARIDGLRRSGKLHVKAGRIQQIVPEGRRLRVAWRPRGTETTAALTVDMVVNATGPNNAIARSEDALVMALRTSGLLSSDPLDLGIRTAAYGACVDATGSANTHLYYVGPMLRADHLDATAAAELRDHAERLAGQLAANS